MTAPGDELAPDASAPGPSPRAVERLADLVDHAGVGIIEFDLDGGVQYVNGHWRRLTGITDPLPMPGDRLLQHLHPDDREPVTQQWLAALASGQPYDSLSRFLLPDGSQRSVQARTRPLLDGAGRVTGFVASLIDITRSARTEPLAAMTGGSGSLIGHVVIAPDGSIVEANEGFTALLRTTEAELVGTPVFDLVDERDLDAVVQAWQALSDGQEFVAEEVRFRRADGTSVWLLGGGSPVWDDAGTQVGFQAIVFDVSSRRAALEALSESEARHRVVVESLHEGVLIIDPDGRLEALNPSARAMLGLHRPDLRGTDLTGLSNWRFVDELGRPLAIEDIPAAVTLRTGQPFHDVVLGIDRADRPRLWLAVDSHPHERPDGRRGMVLSLRDVTGAKLAQDALRESEARYRTLVQHAPIGQLVSDLDGRVVHCNQAYAELIGLPAEQLIGEMPWDRIHPDDLHEVGEGLARVLAGEIDAFDAEYRALRADGSAQWVRGPISLVTDEDGRPYRIHAFIENVHERRAAQQWAARLARIVESTSDLVGTVDPESGQLLYLNRAARECLGYLDHDIGVVDARDLYTPASARRWETDIAVALEMGRTWQGELDMVRADGEPIHVLQSITADLDDRGDIRQISFVGRDVTDLRRRERDLAHQATHDPLTDLPNRALLLQLIDHALHQHDRDDQLIALLFLDLDRFKVVNDSLGHEIGDRLLVQVAERIASTLRPSDTVARLGGDEFVVLCEDIRDEHQAVAITQRITGAIEAHPFDVAGNRLRVTASVGIALATGRDAHPEGLLRDADAAMYRAKDHGRARHELFDDDMRRRTSQRLELADDLALAIERGQIGVHYQPIIDLRTGRVEGVEALARWHHPLRGVLPPYEFIGLAEETGLIVGLGLSVLSRACDQARRWEVELGNRAPKVHVNLSARQLAASNLPRLVKSVIDQSLIEPDRLCLEVTESVLMEDAPGSVHTLEELKAIGVELAIDDFGTGYSSLAYLGRFPVDVLKIDRPFVDGLGPDPEDSEIVAVVVSLAKSLGLGCVAEGVETATQLAGLRALGCEQAQGFFFARPQPVPEVNRYLTRTYPVDGEIDLRHRR